MSLIDLFLITLLTLTFLPLVGIFFDLWVNYKGDK